MQKVLALLLICALTVSSARSATGNTLACALDRQLHWQLWPEWAVFSFCFRKVKVITLPSNTTTFKVTNRLPFLKWVKTQYARS